MNIEWITQLMSQLPFHLLDYVVISFNLFIFLFAAFIIKNSPKAASDSTARNRILALRVINLTLFFIYVFAGAMEYLFDVGFSHLQQISQTGLTILVSYIVMHYVQGWIVYRFGKEKDIDGEKIRGESYASEIIGLIALVLIGSIALLVIINIWDLNDWLQATSVLGGIILILFASKDYFLGDLINGLVMHYNRSVEAGSVIRVKEFDLIGVVLQITLSQTIIRDLVQKHEVTIPNSKLRNATVETISNCGKNGFRDFLDFKIGYDQTAERVQSFLGCVFIAAANTEAGINQDAKPSIVVVENGDHAVTWRLFYFVKNPYRILNARNTIQTIAFELSQAQKIGLNTPVTHHILSNTYPVGLDLSRQ
jgi:small-conductance mechanosensitive channel